MTSVASSEPCVVYNSNASEAEGKHNRNIDFNHFCLDWVVRTGCFSTVKLIQPQSRKSQAHSFVTGFTHIEVCQPSPAPVARASSKNIPTAQFRHAEVRPLSRVTVTSKPTCI